MPIPVQIPGGGIQPQPPQSSDIAAAKSWLSDLLAKFTAAYTALEQPQTEWAKGLPGWTSDAENPSADLHVDLMDATTIGNVFASGAQKVTDPTAGMSSLNIQGQVATIGSLLDELQTARAAMNLSITPSPPPPGANVAADALLQLNALAAALANGNMGGAQIALDNLAGDIQVIAGSGSTNASGSVAVGSVGTGAATAIGVGGLAVGAVAGGLVGHAIASGALFAGEARESRRKRRR